MALALLWQAIAGSASEAVRVEVVTTGYYCTRIDGYYVGDGGGWCGPTASTLLPFPGAAACGSALGLYAWVYIEELGQWLWCVDTGHLAPNGVDVFYPTNQALVESGVLGIGRTTAWVVWP